MTTLIDGSVSQLTGLAQDTRIYGVKDPAGTPSDGYIELGTLFGANVDKLTPSGSPTFAGLTLTSITLSGTGTFGNVVINDSASTPPLRVVARSTPPSSPVTNDIYLDDGTNTSSGNPAWRRYNGTAWEDINYTATVPADVVGVNVVIGSGTSVVSTGVAGYFKVPFACTIEEWDLLADQSGSIQIDIWKDTYANFPPTDADSITGANEPAISSAQKAQDTTLTGWTTTINADDILAFNVDSATTIQQVTLHLKLRRT